ncbi:MAG: alpha/beta hydrolase [Chloroflexota bacterium]|uniref:BD-FAE-like domain-containing protein n=1 Tax=marine metagenome TaxID=408172 RepID=A0A381R6H9_9ZZZZ|nr:alpha/beta hydrolase [Chloroflexota bacterium]
MVAYDPAHKCEISVHESEYQSGLAVRIYQPVGAGPFPGLVDVHGGVWTNGDRSANEVMDRALAESGMVVAAVDFRQSPDHPYPAQVADVNLATRWLKAHAVEFNADPDTVGGIAGSSGGHTVLLSAMRPNHPAYSYIDLPGSDADASMKYLLLGWPIVDPYARYRFVQEMGNDRIIGLSEAYFRTTDAMKEGSPGQILQRGEEAALPPTLIVQGTADNNLPVPVTERFAADYRKAGGDLELEMFPDMPHLFGNTPGPDSDRAIALMKKFASRILSEG